ncbi:MAG: SDR family oxidoreductase [Cyclobacteriaceae bacterium]|nr:SDR family oxidoreductase [Cyclobacteriaceae bacterium]
MDLKLKNKTVFVTGASRGIGEATARFLAMEGCNIFVGYHTGFDSAENIAMDIRRMGRKAWLVKMNMADENEVNIGVREIIEIAGSLDILVLNAGHNILTPFENLKNEEWDEIIRINLSGPFYIINALKNHFNEGSSVILVSSVAGHTGAPHHVHYAAAKAGMINLTRSLAKAMAPRTRVNCVAPGLTRTDMGEKTMAVLTDNYVKEKLLAQRMADPHEIGALIAFLASPVSGFIYGETININGGRDFR